jgi:uncharacterized protein
MSMDDVEQHLRSIPLVDHHVHGAFVVDIDRREFETHINEGSPEPIPEWMTMFDSQLGFSIRRHCAPLLDLEPNAPADAYWQRRTELGRGVVTSRFLNGANISDWVLDTGFSAGVVHTPAQLAAVVSGKTHEIVRIEVLAEQMVAEGVTAGEYIDGFRARLRSSTATAVGVKTIVAYRAGLDIDFSRPGAAQVERAAQRWITETGSAAPRLTDPTLLAFGVNEAIDLGLPIQIHAAFGDRDLDLARCNPIHMMPFLRRPDVNKVPITLLHCYPYHREAGYLAEAFTNVYMDVGLGVNYTGTRSSSIIAEALEVVPFAKVLFSTDAWGPPELHYLGAALWRESMIRVLRPWVDQGDWTAADAIRVVDMIGRNNALRLYGLE